VHGILSPALLNQIQLNYRRLIFFFKNGTPEPRWIRNRKLPGSEDGLDAPLASGYATILLHLWNQFASDSAVQKVVEGLPLPPPTMEDTFPQENPESLQKAVIECLEEELEACAPIFIFLLFIFIYNYEIIGLKQ
jgi:hypothetical protein